MTTRAMAGGTLDSQVGAPICNGLGIKRACLELLLLRYSVQVRVRSYFFHDPLDGVGAPAALGGAAR